MRKTLKLAGIFAVLIVLGIFLLQIENRIVQFVVDDSSMPVLSLKVNDSEELLEPWFNKREGRYYFFLPSFVSDNRVYCDYLKEDAVLEGEKLSKGKSFRWEQDKVYTLLCGDEEYKVVFMKSANIPALFVETESGTMEHLNADKELVETGSISVVQETNNVEYQGKLKKISARGNSTFDNKDKKAYSFTLNNSYPLCGMDAGKKWNLLALYLEYDKIHTKMVYDIADVLGMEYNIDCTWVDLYCNGEYQGLYLLTEAVTVGEGRVDIYDLEKAGTDNMNISGGYLIEKDVESHLEKEGNGFITQQCNYPFVVKNPEPATEEQMNYISSYIQNIENMLVADDKEYKKFIDLDSFAKQFLIDKIALEPDAMNMSTFYYKEMDSEILKAGPLWDYDRAFGEALPQYTLSIGDYPGNMHDWYMQLYADEEFKEKMISYYRQLLPFFEDMLDGGIDEYADYISASVKMDAVMWPNEYNQSDMMGYLEYDNHIKYLKFFLANRLNYLNEIWEISDWKFEVPEATGKEHAVQFVMDDGSLLETKKVPDGSIIEGIPQLDTDKYLGWQMNEDGKIYNSYIPIYEDVVLNARREFESLDERMSYKLERVYRSEDLLSYMKELQDKDFSVCVFMDGSSELVQDANVLDGIKSICDYKHPDWLDKALDAKKDYFIVIDNGWRKIWDSVTENLKELNTTFGMVRYEDNSEGDVSLYIQENETDYLDSQTRGALTFVVINRYTGEIVDVAAFE